MDAVIWVETLSRHGHVLARQRCDGRVIRIGRGYGNDVVIDDPYVAPEHVQILRETGGGLVVEDLGSANGLYGEHGRTKVAQLALGNDGVFRIGHTILRIRTPDHAVAMERVVRSRRHAWVLLAGLMVATLGLGDMLIWTTDFSEPQLAHYVVPLVALAVVVVMWSTLWAAASRISSGEARFDAHLAIGFAAALGIETWYAASEWAAFAFSSAFIAAYRSLGFWCVAALAAYIHLRRISPRRALVKGGVVAALLVSAVAVEVVVELDPHVGLERHYVRALLPPVLRATRAADEASFFAAVDKLEPKLEADRTKAP